MDTAVLAAQVLLGITFVAAGANHALNFASASQRPQMAWLAAVGRDRMRIIGGLEVLGGVALLIAWPIGQPWLATLAAASLVALMTVAAVFHARRGERSAIVVNVVLGLVAAFVLYGRLVIEPA